MNDLNDFGIHEGISEMIFTTISSDGVPNAAPMGLHRKDGRLFARIYNSKTLENIIEKPVAAANIVDDPVLFVQSALSDIALEDFEFIGDFPVLKGSKGWIIFDCKYKKGDVSSIVELMPSRGKINNNNQNKNIKPVNRGFNAVIEALIHATRYLIAREEKYLDRIKYYDTIVRKCGGSREQEAMRLLYEFVD